MSIFSLFTGLFSNAASDIEIDSDLYTSITNDLFENTAISNIDMTFDDHAINPANGLPMVGGSGGVDIENNPFGTDFSHDDAISSGIDDSFGSSFDSSFDDSFGSSFDDW